MAYELTIAKPLFPGRSDLDQLHLIIQLMGSLPDSFLNQIKKHTNVSNLKVSYQNRMNEYVLFYSTNQMTMYLIL